MKTYLIVFLIIGITSTSIAQEKFNNQSSQELNTVIVKLNSNNSKYLSQVKHKETPIKVEKLQNIVAKFNIEDAKVYNTNYNGTYDVTFDETNSKIVATYNANGEIIESSEEFKNVRLPNTLIKTVLNEYPQWRLVGNTQSVHYKEDKGVTKIYAIDVTDGNKKKTLKFKLTNQPYNNYVAVN
ncbi:MAG: hypothetical protein HKO01_07665 [Flaviramulus sp.]|nr:hypothetical protein [Flaviramulus sp.]NNC50395.1 hypothetical protein [Flaviramulus sp.]